MTLPSEETIQSFANLLAHGMIEYSDLIENGFDEIARELMVERSKSLLKSKSNNNTITSGLLSRGRNSEQQISKRNNNHSEDNCDDNNNDDITQSLRERYFEQLRIQQDEEDRIRKQQLLKMERQVRTEAHLHKNNQKKVGEDGEEINDEDEQNVDENVKRMLLEMMTMPKNNNNEDEEEDLRFRHQGENNNNFVVKTHEDDVMLKQQQDFDDDLVLKRFVQQAQERLQKENEEKMENENRRFDEYLQNPNSSQCINKKKFHREE
jgi:hypothetical protein